MLTSLARAGAAALFLAILLGAPASAADPTLPPCRERYPNGAPAGVDLTKLCVASELVRNYTSAQADTPDVVERALLALAAGGLAGAVAVALWTRLRGRAGRRLADAHPAVFWLCDGCRSFNPTGDSACYRCHRPRSPDARLVEAPETPAWEQRFGRPFDG